MAEKGWNSLYLGNHDQPRCVTRFGNDSPEHREQSAKSLATVLHLHRGTPYVYEGDELGLPNAGYTRIDQLRDVESLNRYAEAVAAGQDPADVMAALSAKGRDNARVPMPWNASAHGGFTTGTPWIDAHPDAATINVAAQEDDPDSVMSHYGRLIALRHDEPAVGHGTFRMLLPDDEQVYAFLRELDGTRLLVVANLSDEDGVVADLAEAGDLTGAELALGSVAGSSPTATDPLAAWESRVYRLA
jgi:oligo-1,6-glucosidase